MKRRLDWDLEIEFISGKLTRRHWTDFTFARIYIIIFIFNPTPCLQRKGLSSFTFRSPAVSEESRLGSYLRADIVVHGVDHVVEQVDVQLLREVQQLPGCMVR